MFHKYLAEFIFTRFDAKGISVRASPGRFKIHSLGPLPSSPLYSGDVGATMEEKLHAWSDDKSRDRPVQVLFDTLLPRH